MQKHVMQYFIPFCRISGPIPGITPSVDTSVPGKFAVRGKDGRILPLHPKASVVSGGGGGGGLCSHNCDRGSSFDQRFDH